MKIIRSLKTIYNNNIYLSMGIKYVVASQRKLNNYIQVKVNLFFGCLVLYKSRNEEGCLWEEDRDKPKKLE